MGIVVNSYNKACYICEHWKVLYEAKVQGRGIKVPNMIPYNGPICANSSPAEKQTESVNNPQKEV